MKIGYARISTKEQDIKMQIDALEKEGCRPIFQETISGAKAERPEWKKCLECLREGDTLIVWAIDRMGRTLKEQINAIDEVTKKGIKIYSTSQRLDSTTQEGMFCINMLCVMAEDERNRTRLRSAAGMEAARKRGIFGGRRHRHKPKMRQMISEMYLSQKYNLKEICDMYKISMGTIYNYINEFKNADTK